MCNCIVGAAASSGHEGSGGVWASGHSIDGAGGQR